MSISGDKSSRVISPHELVRKLDGWNNGDDARELWRRLAEAIKDFIDQDQPPAGTRLPAERPLAAQLVVSRTTVVHAYAYLRDELRYVESLRGSGVRVCGSDAATRSSSVSNDGRLATFTGSAREEVNLSSGALDGIPDVLEARAAVTDAELEPYLDGDGYWPSGIPSLRAAVAEYYRSLGLPTDIDQILITNGSQHALWLLTRQQCKPGTAVVVEDPTYRGALSIFAHHNLHRHAVSATEDGPRLSRLREITNRTRVRMVYLLPTAHNPLGYTMSETARENLARFAREKGLFLVDDGSTSETLFDDRSPTSLARLLPTDQVATIGTVSKLFWGGLRVGWVRASRQRIKDLADIRAAMDFGGSVIDQLTAAKLLERIEEIRAERRAWLRQCYDDTDAILREFAPSWQWQRPSGGSTLWVRVPGVDAGALRSLARSHNVVVTTGMECSPEDGHGDVLRIPFARPQEDLRCGIATLAKLADDPRVAAT